ncbi:GumC domain-containing protein [Sediminibacterium salmoneum]|uniref:hypothetical protein n=1 Tax=Sediminibacterium salmoneum TaxID=426421 RepID=UPI00047A8D22|nr:hypothetical protein [Sediminibacterium salmoneum]
MNNQIANTSDNISAKEILQNIGEWVRFLSTNWWKVAIIGLIGGFLGFVYARKQPVTYEAKTTFVVEDGKSGTSGLGGLASLAGQFGMDMSIGGGGLLSGDNIIFYFKSFSLSREVLLTQFGYNPNESFADVYVNAYQLKDSWKKNENIGDVNFPPLILGKNYTRLQDSLLLIISEDIINTKFSIGKTDKKAGLFDVSVIMENETLAKFYCERIVQLAVDKYLRIRTQRQKVTVEKLQARADSIASLLSKKTISGASLQTNSSVMDINPLYQTKNTVAVETTLRDKTMLTTIFSAVTQNLEMAKFTLSQETPVIQIVDAPILPLKRSKISSIITALLFSLGWSFILVFVLIMKRIFSKIME